MQGGGRKISAWLGLLHRVGVCSTMIASEFGKPGGASSMKIAFWNINRNKDVTHVVNLVDRAAPDVLFIAECSPEIVESLQSLYRMLVPIVSDKPKVRGFVVSENLKCLLKHEFKDRLSLYQLTWNSKEFLLGTVHLLPKNNASSQAQSLEAMKYVHVIQRFEREQRQKNTIIIGDFNMNPFDPGMVSASAFNAVCSPEIALKQSRRFQGDNYDYFFNPAWKNYAGIGDEIYGTYYYHAYGMDEFLWNNFDQVLVRPSILRQYNPKFSVMHDILGFDLRTRNNEVSDHYPILLELKEK